ncbi:MAG: TolC family protein [Polyangiaceae bacterium]
MVALLSTSLAAHAEDPPASRITLQAAVQQAMARYPTAETAEIDIRRSEALVKEARAGILPTLNANGLYTRLDSDRVQTIPGSAPRTLAAVDTISANLTLTVPIIVPQRWAPWSHAKDNVDVFKATAVDVRRQVAVATARAYLSVLVQRRVLEVSVLARDTAKAHFDFAHQRFVGGVGNRLDEVRAAQELATDEASVQSSRAAVARSREALGVLVATEGPVDGMDDTVLPAPPDLNAALGGTKTRSDVRVAESKTEAARHTVRDDWTDYSPYLVGIAQPFYQNPASLTVPATGWQAQLVLTIPLYDGGLRYGLADERRANLDSARVVVDGTLRQARSDVRTAFETMERADEGLTASRSAARLAGEALELATIAYRAGATTNLEVIDAERAARNAELQAAVAEDNARQARLDLLYSSGRFP